MAGESLLVFQAGGRRLAVPLGLLIGVSEARYTPLPLASPSHLGLMVHKDVVYPVFDPLRLAGVGALKSQTELVVLVEVAGEGVALACNRVEGAARSTGAGESDGGSDHAVHTVAGWPALVPALEAALDRELGR